jgi:hypothetical protein
MDDINVAPYRLDYGKNLTRLQHILGKKEACCDDRAIHSERFWWKWWTVRRRVQIPAYLRGKVHICVANIDILVANISIFTLYVKRVLSVLNVIV